MTFELVMATAYLTCGALMLFLGLVVLRENPRQRVHQATAGMLVFSGLGPILGAYSSLAAPAAGDGSRLFQDVFAEFAYLWEFFFPSVLLFALVFPGTHAVLRRWPHLSWALFLPHGFHVLLLTVLSDSADYLETFDFGTLPWGIGVLLEPAAGIVRVAVGLILRVHVRFFSFVNLAMAVTSWVLLMRSARRTLNPKLRAQVRTIRLGIGISLALYSGGELVPKVFGITLERVYSLPLVTVSLLVGAVSILVAIVRLGFLDVRFIVRRGLVYGLAAGVIVALYLFVGKQIDRLSARLFGEPLPVFETTFLLLSVFLLQPALAAIERRVDRTYSRDRSETRNALMRLAEEVSLILDPEEVCRAVATTIRREMILSTAAVVAAHRTRGLYRLTLSREGEEEVETVEYWSTGKHLLEAVAGHREIVPVREVVEVPRDSEDRRRLQEEMQRIGADLVIPLWVAVPDRENEEGEGRELVGAVLLGERVTETRITFEETSLVSLIARQLGISLVNAGLHEEQVAVRLLEKEVATARKIQEQLLPESPPALQGWELSASNRPSHQVGGDYHDFLPLPGGQMGIAIGDVSGKGVPAALLMSNLQAALRVRALGGLPTDRIVEDVNRQICRNTGAESFISFFLAELIPDSGELTFTNAGHNAPVLVRRDGRVETLEAGGLLLGVFPEATYERDTVGMDPGDCLVFYTDGVTEASNPAGDLFSEKRLVNTLIRHRESSATTLHRRVMEEVAEFQEGLPPDDDLTFIVLKRTENGISPGGVE
jgi:sigma-B regulation protein RsbU (phosphoserine phosphatase)